ncbi:hypothetical protein PROFUN_13342 [Planoprotostelium fungivorum]|uniref:Lipin/Ned1/Smp2 (LNS2) domain-containing protein n=1 Tax=Planoprotostelium fungivorum TaxID=1890364 RepID=A0A2P6N4N7_9EUKA|nr:hypothetical protein PROFUN_13342 [Planoprotostelium fungivorum]
MKQLPIQRSLAGENSVSDSKRSKTVLANIRFHLLRPTFKLSLRRNLTTRIISAEMKAKRRNRIHHHSWDYTNSRESYTPPRSPQPTPHAIPASVTNTIATSVTSSPKVWRARANVVTPRKSLEQRYTYRITEAQDCIVLQKPDTCMISEPIFFCVSRCRTQGESPIQVIDVTINGRATNLSIVFSTPDDVRMVDFEQIKELSQNSIKRRLFTTQPSNNTSCHSSPGIVLRKAISDSNLKESLESPDGKKGETGKGLDISSSCESQGLANALATGKVEEEDILDMTSARVVPTPEQLEEMNLQPGENHVMLCNKNTGANVQFRIHLWRHDVRILLVDIDHSIMGRMDPQRRKGWRGDFEPLVDMLHSAYDRGYRIVYHSSRHIKLAHQTWMLLDLIKLPPGSILLDVPNCSTQDQLRALVELHRESRGCHVESNANLPNNKNKHAWHKLTNMFMKSSNSRQTNVREPLYTAAFGEYSEDIYGPLNVAEDRVFSLPQKNCVYLAGKPLGSTEAKKKLTTLWKTHTEHDAARQRSDS